MLRNPGDYQVTADTGNLWFESAEQSLQFKNRLLKSLTLEGS